MSNNEKIDARFGSGVVRRVYNILGAKVGGTAGWVVAGAADNNLATLPAGSTASTMVLALDKLQIGDEIVGYHLLGQIESGGNAASLQASIRAHTVAAADVAEGGVTGTIMTTLSVTADTAVNESNAARVIPEAARFKVEENKTYFMLFTGTTAASTDIALMGVVLYVRPVR